MVSYYWCPQVVKAQDFSPPEDTTSWCVTSARCHYLLSYGSQRHLSAVWCGSQTSVKHIYMDLHTKPNEYLPFTRKNKTGHLRINWCITNIFEQILQLERSVWTDSIWQCSGSHLMGQCQPSGTPFKNIFKLVLLMQQCLEHRNVIKQGIWGHQINVYWSCPTSVDCPIHLTSTVID